MKRIRIRLLVTVATVLTIVLTGMVALPADARLAPPVGADPGVDPGFDPGMVAAVQRDLGISADQARARLAAVVPSARIEAGLRAWLGSRFGGAWMDLGGTRLVVGITDPADAATVWAAGARPIVVARSEQWLKSVHAKLDRRAQRAPKSVTAWYVDPETNSVVVEALPTALAAARAFVTTSGADQQATRVVPSTGPPRPLELPVFYDVRGGDAIYPPPSGSRCSVGFSVEGGFVTAGHCVTVGTTIKGYNNKNMGTVAGSSFPGNDYGWVDTNHSWVTKGVVNNYAGGTIPVDGALPAPPGSPVCRSGSTTGWRCGTIGPDDQTVNYPQGTVYELTRTTACAEPGDSGGSFISSGQAQGVLSGGSGNCTAGGITYFQPLLEILRAYRLLLITTSSPVTIHELACEFRGPPQYFTPQYRCQVTYYGGAAPYTHRWTRDGGTPTPPGSSTVIGGPCREGDYHTVWVEVTDSRGRQATAQTEFTCPAF